MLNPQQSKEGSFARIEAFTADWVSPCANAFPFFIEAATQVIRAISMVEEQRGMLTPQQFYAVAAACDCLTAGLYHEDIRAPLIYCLEHYRVDGLPEIIRNLASDFGSFAEYQPDLTHSLTNELSQSLDYRLLFATLIAVANGLERVITGLTLTDKALLSRLATDSQEDIHSDFQVYGNRFPLVLPAYVERLRHLRKQVEAVPACDGSGTASSFLDALKQVTGISFYSTPDKLECQSEVFRTLLAVSHTLVPIAQEIAQTCEMLVRDNTSEEGLLLKRSTLNADMISQLKTSAHSLNRQSSGAESVLFLAAAQGILPCEYLLTLFVESCFPRIEQITNALRVLRLACAEADSDDSMELREAIHTDQHLISRLALHLGQETSTLLVFGAKASGTTVSAHAVKKGLATPEELSIWLSELRNPNY